LRNRLVSLFIVVTGILTMFYSSITTDLPVRGMVRWSPFTIMLQMYRGALPSPVCERCDEPLIRSIVGLPSWLTMQYLLLVVALIALCFGAPSKVLVVIAFVGLCDDLRAWSPVSVATRVEFDQTFFGSYRGGHVHFDELMVAHVVVMTLLLMTCLDCVEQESA